MQAALRKRGPNAGAYSGQRNRRTVWEAALRPFKEAHFAVFPEELIEPCVLAGAPQGDLVLDPFAGAGTTGLVAVKNGRRFLGIELNSECADLARGGSREKTGIEEFSQELPLTKVPATNEAERRKSEAPVSASRGVHQKANKGGRSQPTSDRERGRQAAPDQGQGRTATRKAARGRQAAQAAAPTS